MQSTNPGAARKGCWLQNMLPCWTSCKLLQYCFGYKAWSMSYKNDYHAAIRDRWWSAHRQLHNRHEWISGLPTLIQLVSFHHPFHNKKEKHENVPLILEFSKRDHSYACFALYTHFLQAILTNTADFCVLFSPTYTFQCFSGIVQHFILYRDWMGIQHFSSKNTNFKENWVLWFLKKITIRTEI